MNDEQRKMDKKLSDAARMVRVTKLELIDARRDRTGACIDRYERGLVAHLRAVEAHAAIISELLDGFTG